MNETHLCKESPNWIKRLSQVYINFYEIFCLPIQTKQLIFSKLEKVWCNKVFNFIWKMQTKFLTDLKNANFSFTSFADPNENYFLRIHCLK